MIRQSGRERKIVVPFEDQLSAATLVSSPGQTIAQPAPKPRLKKAPRVKKETPQPETVPSTPARRNPGRPKGSSSGGGRSAVQSVIHGERRAGSRPAKRQRLQGPLSDDTNEILSSSPIRPADDDSSNANVESDSDFEDDENDGIPLAQLLQHPGPITPRRTAKFGLTRCGNLNTDSDPVIEQWYADPYERIDPSGPAYDIWRHQNILRSLQNRGFSLLRAQSLATWLMRCNGRYQDFEESKNPRIWYGGRMKKGKKRSKNERRDASKTPSVDPEAGLSSRGASVGRQMLVEFDLNLQQAGGRTNGGAHEEEEESDEHGESTVLVVSTANTPCRQSSPAHTRQPGTLVNAASADTNLRRLAASNALKLQTPAPTVGEEEEEEDETGSEDEQAARDEAIAKLKRSLKLFDLIYGDDLPDPDYMGYEITHTSSVTNLPRAVPRQGFRTQGHHPLHQAILEENDVASTNHINESEPGVAKPELHVREVLTEDDEFGLTLFAPQYTCTDAELALYNEERRIAMEVETKIAPVKEFLVKYKGKGRSMTKGRAADANDESERAVTPAVTDTTSPKTTISPDNLDSKANDAAEELRMEVIEQLKEQIFKWETNDMLEKSQVGAFDAKSYPMDEGETILHRDKKDKHFEKKDASGATIMDAIGKPVLQEEDDPAWPGHAKKTLHSWRTIKYLREDRARKLAAGGPFAEEIFKHDRMAAKKEKIRLQSIVWRENARARKRATSLE